MLPLYLQSNPGPLSHYSLLNGSVTVPFVIPSAAEGSAVPRTPPGNASRRNVATECPRPSRRGATWRNSLRLRLFRNSGPPNPVVYRKRDFSGIMEDDSGAAHSRS
jgi:hypothetical protein